MLLGSVVMIGCWWYCLRRGCNSEADCPANPHPYAVTQTSRTERRPLSTLDVSATKVHCSWASQICAVLHLRLNRARCPPGRSVG